MRGLIMCRTPVIDAPVEYISLNHLQIATRQLSLTILHASPTWSSCLTSL